MCKMAEYPGLYMKTMGLLREVGIKPETPGYEILRRAIVVYKVHGRLPEGDFLRKVKDNIVIPSNKELAGKLEAKERDIAIQWMIEAIMIANIIQDESESVEDSLMSFINEMAHKL